MTSYQIKKLNERVHFKTKPFPLCRGGLRAGKVSVFCFEFCFGTQINSQMKFPSVLPHATVLMWKEESSLSHP